MLTPFSGTALIRVRVSNSNNALLLQNPNFQLLANLISSRTQTEAGSFTLSYLINSCGLSPESASSVSNSIQIRSPRKPDAVIDLFKNHGFSQTQIFTMIRKFPRVLVANPKKIILPKLDYMYSVGVSRSEVARLLSRYPWVFGRSLEEQIIPTFDFLRDFLQSNEKAVTAIKSYTYVLTEDLDRNFKPNITTLRDNGVDDTIIRGLAQYHTHVLLTRARDFNETVEKVKELCFNPKEMKFCLALKALMKMSKSKWEKKVGIYRSWGWSEELFHKAFLKNPLCMLISEDKLMAAMEFFVNELGVDSSFIAEYPYMLQYSLEGRIIPRCLLHKALVLKGLIKETYALTSLLSISTQSFEDKFLKGFLQEAPELLEIYERKVGP